MVGPNALLMSIIKEVWSSQDNCRWQPSGGDPRGVCKDLPPIPNQAWVINSLQPWTILAHSTIRELKVGIWRTLRRAKAPRCLCCFCGKWLDGNKTTTDGALYAATPRKSSQRKCAGVSAWHLPVGPVFGFYEPIMYWEPVSTFSHEKKLLSLWLGVVKVTTGLMASYLFTKTGKIIARKSLRIKWRWLC